MSSEGARSNRGIRVRRETTVSVEDDDSQWPPRVTTTIRSGQPGYRPREPRRPRTFHASSRSADINNSSFLADASEDVLSRTRSERQTSRDLADFLRNTPPPPRNFMSAPDPFDEEEKSKRRHSFWPFRRKSKIESTRPASELIKLPDTAVAGRTIGGHRHIAISIPVEHAHLNPLSRETLPSPATSRRHTSTNLRQFEQIPKIPRSRRASMPDDRFSLLWHPSDSLTPEHHPETRNGGAEPARSLLADTLVGAHSMNVTPPPELTALQKGPVSPADLVTNSLPDRRAGSLRRPHSVHFYPVHDSDTYHAVRRRLVDQDLARTRTARSKSFSSSSSEPISSDAVTFHIPSPQFPARFPEWCPYPRVTDAESTSLSATEFDHSSLTSPSQGAADRAGPSQYQAPRSFPTPPLSETIDQIARWYSTPGYPAVSPPRTLESFPSLESFPPKREVPHQTLQITPVMTVVDIPSIEPSPPSPGSRPPSPDTFYTASSSPDPPPLPDRSPDRHLRSMPGNINIRNSNRRTITFAPLPDLSPTTSSHTSSSLTSPHNPLTLPRSSPPSPPEDFNTIVARLDQLESRTDRWINTLIPMFERISHGLLARPSRLHMSLRQASGSYMGPARYGRVEELRGREGFGTTGWARYPRTHYGTGGESSYGYGNGNQYPGSWLRSESSLGVGGESRDGVMSYREHEALVVSGGEGERQIRWEGRDDDRDTIVAEPREIHQQRPETDEEDPEGWGVLESVMRELVMGARDKRDARDAREEALGSGISGEDSAYGRWFTQSNGFNTY